MLTKRTATELFSENAGFIKGRPCHLGGWIVIYRAEEAGIDHDPKTPLVVMHEPSSLHVCVGNMKDATHIMNAVARAPNFDEARRHADILPEVR